jgi:hypothetical protein
MFQSSFNIRGKEMTPYDFIIYLISAWVVVVVVAISHVSI